MRDHPDTLRAMRNLVGVHTCLDCEHRTVTSDPNYVGCKLADNITPPIDVIVYGCNKWVQDIPF